MTAVPARLARIVVARATDRCEYCRLSQEGQEATFHIDHTVPIVAGGETVAENLALACVSCSLRKGARVEALDPDGVGMAPLFNPRHNDWNEHFRWKGLRIVGLTAAGRATVEALQLNRPRMLYIRRTEQRQGRHPPA